MDQHPSSTSSCHLHAPDTAASTPLLTSLPQHRGPNAAARCHLSTTQRHHHRLQATSSSDPSPLYSSQDANPHGRRPPSSSSPSSSLFPSSAHDRQPSSSSFHRGMPMLTVGPTHLLSGRRFPAHLLHCSRHTRPHHRHAHHSPRPPISITAALYPSSLSHGDAHRWHIHRCHHCATPKPPWFAAALPSSSSIARRPISLDNTALMVTIHGHLATTTSSSLPRSTAIAHCTSPPLKPTSSPSPLDRATTMLPPSCHTTIPRSLPSLIVDKHLDLPGSDHPLPYYHHLEPPSSPLVVLPGATSGCPLIRHYGYL